MAISGGIRMTDYRFIGWCQGKYLPVRAKHSSFQYLQSYILDLMIFSIRYCGFVPFIVCASFTVRFAIFYNRIRFDEDNVNLLFITFHNVTAICRNVCKQVDSYS